MKINWKVRVKNPVFWVSITLAVMSPILAYLGISWESITTWGALWDIFVQAVKNPVIVVAVICSVYGAIIDPTTKGLSDSEQAMTYTTPKSN
jgi:phi LC3 family holin